MTGWPMRRIVIAGGGTAGWMAAAAIGRTLGATAEVTLVESDAIGTIGVGESTIPPLITFNRLLGIDEAGFMRATQATFKLGILFDNWRAEGDRYFHSFGPTGTDHWSAGFQHFWLDGLQRGHNHPYDDYGLELKAALAGKFAHLPDERMNYAYQLDSGLYAKFLRQMAEGDGVKRMEGKIASVDLDGTSGNIASLTLESGERIEGDLFLDCTGFRALLIGDALGVGFDDWSHWLPCDSAIAIQTRSPGPALPYTRAMAHAAGWQWRIPLQHRTGNGLVYAAAHLERDAALEQLLGNVEGETLTPPNFLRFMTGARRLQWHKNCVAIGLSGGFMEPLESTSIHLIQRAVLRFLRMLPMGEVSERDVAEFNDQQLTDMVQIRDFLILHYKATERGDSEFWRYCRDMPVPDSLEQKIELFRETGRVFRKNEELFTENSWVQVMMGQGIMPRSLSPDRDQADRRGDRAVPGVDPGHGRQGGRQPARASRLCRALLRGSAGERSGRAAARERSGLKGRWGGAAPACSDDPACRGRRGRVAADRQPGDQQPRQRQPRNAQARAGVDRQARLRAVDRCAADERLAFLSDPGDQRPRADHRRLVRTAGHRLDRPDAVRRNDEMRRAWLSDDDRAGRHAQRPCRAASLRATIAALQPDGVILTPPHSENELIAKLLSDHKITFARIGSVAPGPGIAMTMDDEHAARLATEHLARPRSPPDRVHQRVERIYAEQLAGRRLARGHGGRRPRLRRSAR